MKQVGDRKMESLFGSAMGAGTLVLLVGALFLA